jgi:hypothetical protein
LILLKNIFIKIDFKNIFKIKMSIILDEEKFGKYQKFYNGKLIIYNYKDTYFFYKNKCYVVNDNNYCYQIEDEKYIEDQITLNLINQKYYQGLFYNYLFNIEHFINNCLVKKIIAYNNNCFFYFNDFKILTNGFNETCLEHYLSFLIINFVYDNVYNEIYLYTL